MTRRGHLLVGWTLAVAAIVLFTSLGTWQSRRAVEKQAMLDAAAEVLARRVPRGLEAAADPERRHAYDWAEGRGEFLDRAPLLLDNQQHEGRVGVRAYRVFQPESGQRLLVDLGWLPIGGQREMPDIGLPSGTQRLGGLLSAPPSAGLALGPAMAREGDAWLLTRVDMDAIARALDLGESLAPRVLRLDPALPLGYTRDLVLLPNTLPPDKHRGYAVQWFGLALTVLATALILTFKKKRTTP